MSLVWGIKYLKDYVESYPHDSSSATATVFGPQKGILFTTDACYNTLNNILEGQNKNHKAT